MRKLTHEEQVAAIAEVNPDVEVLGEITRDNKKVLCRCKVCDCKWMGMPRNIKRGNGCPKCARLKRTQRLTLSHEEQITIIAKVNPDVEVLGKIINNSTKVLCICNVHKIEFLMSPEHLKQGQGCKKCRYSKMAQKRTISHEEQVVAIAKVNPDVEVIGRITGCGKKVLCRCKVCGHEWSVTPSDLKHGRGCPKCAKSGFLSHDYGKLYIMVDNLELPTQMKIGVSIKENERRSRILKSAHKAGVRIHDLYIVKTLEGPTENIYELERSIHNAFSNYKINFPVKFSGSNEFFYYRPEVFDVVEEAYKEIVCCQ
ncbi:TPA: GIY-YIG nuclease family protein [Escherichia coli]